MQDVTKGHTVEAYNEDLAQVRGLILEMGELVATQVADAVRAMETGDLALGRRVVNRDRKLDEMDMEADEEILRIIALRQPKAVDLRLVMALSKAAGELAKAGNKAKRIGAYAVSMCESDQERPRRRLLRDVTLMKDRACSMLERSLDAMVRLDVSLAAQVVREDDELDEEFDAAMRHLVTFMLQDSSSIAEVLDMVFVLKALERVGDHANHVAEQVIFIAQGRDVRYVSADALGD